MLSLAYSYMVEHADAEHRREIDYALLPEQDTWIDDPDLPEELRTVRPPSWYRHGVPAAGSIRVGV